MIGSLNNARWRLKPHDTGRIESLSREARLSPLVAQLLINRGIEEPARAVAFLEAKMGSLHDPELLPGAVGGRRADRARDSRESKDRHLRRLRRRWGLRHERSLGLPSAGGCDRARILHSAPGRRGLRRQFGRPAAACTGAKGLADRDGRLRNLCDRRGRCCARAGCRADHHGPPHDRARAARGRRDRSSAAAGKRVSHWRSLRGGGGVQAGVASLQILWRRQTCLAAPA